jgi:PKD repeat protein
LLALGTLAVVGSLPQPAFGYTFGEGITPLGPEQLVFDWSTMACEPLDIPDAPARAFHDSSGRVQFLASHFVSLRAVGPDVLHLKHECVPVMSSHFDADPSAFQDREWIASPYTLDGDTVHALLHDEYQGIMHPGMCPTQQWPWCWQNSVTLGISRDGGRSYSHGSPPSHLVASLPYPYAAVSSPYGLFNPSNIIYRQADHQYYALLGAQPYQAQQFGTCLMRTNDLSDPTSWRAWDGTGFGTRFINPYLEPAEPPIKHVCQPVSPGEIARLSASLTYNTYFNKYLLVGDSQTTDPGTGAAVTGFYYSLSDDLIHWTPRKALMYSDTPISYTCGNPPPTEFPSIIDPDSSSRNFETSGQRVYLFYTRFNFNNCIHPGLDRDLIRIPIEFSAPAPGPAASVTATPTTASVGQEVKFDASASGDPDGSITGYKWDLDGDGKLETDTGPDPSVSHSYDRPGTVEMRLRVIDVAGNSADATSTVTITRCRGEKARSALRRYEGRPRCGGKHRR